MYRTGVQTTVCVPGTATAVLDLVGIPTVYRYTRTCIRIHALYRTSRHVYEYGVRRSGTTTHARGGSGRTRAVLPGRRCSLQVEGRCAVVTVGSRARVSSPHCSLLSVWQGRPRQCVVAISEKVRRCALCGHSKRLQRGIKGAELAAQHRPRWGLAATRWRSQSLKEPLVD